MANNEAETGDLDAQFARGYARTSGTNQRTLISVAPVSDGGGVAAEEAGFSTLGDAAEAGGSGVDAADAQEPGIVFFFRSCFFAFCDPPSLCGRRSHFLVHGAQHV